MERFHSISFGLDLGIICQGMHKMPYVIMHYLIKKKTCPQNLQLDTLKSQVPLMKPSVLTDFFAASINHVQFSS